MLVEMPTPESASPHARPDRKPDRLDKGDTLSVGLWSVSRLAELERIWTDLERRSACSFFQSWAWIGCWLRNLPAEIAPRVLMASAGDNLVGLAVLAARRKRRHGWLRTNVLHVNETGIDDIDRIAIEYNGLLADREIGMPTVARHCLAWLVQQEDDWDELALSGLVEPVASSMERIAGELDLGTRVFAEELCQYVDLDSIRSVDNDYLSSLSRNSRYQIRRSKRLYEEMGALLIQPARSVAEAQTFLDEMSQLHQTSWTQRGHLGAFATDFYAAFHRDLVSKSFDAGEVQLLRIAAGPRVIGYLYNFVKDGVVHAYQSGFHFDPDPRLKPGLVSHALAIEYNLKAGARIYDFMAGASQYKRSLGAEVKRMRWLVLYRKRSVLLLEDMLRTVKAKVKEIGKA